MGRQLRAAIIDRSKGIAISSDWYSLGTKLTRRHGLGQRPLPPMLVSDGTLLTLLLVLHLSDFYCAKWSRKSCSYRTEQAFRRWYALNTTSE
jgi:hypothetical protein